MTGTEIEPQTSQGFWIVSVVICWRKRKWTWRSWQHYCYLTLDIPLCSSLMVRWKGEIFRFKKCSRFEPCLKATQQSPSVADLTVHRGIINALVTLPGFEPGKDRVMRSHPIYLSASVTICALLQLGAATKAWQRATMLLPCRSCGRVKQAASHPHLLLWNQSEIQRRHQEHPVWLLGYSLGCVNQKKKCQIKQLVPLAEGSPWAELHSSGPGKAPALNSPKWLSPFNSNTTFSFSKVLIQLDLELFGWVICLKGIILHLLTVVISLLHWLKHLFSAIFSPATHPTPTN